ncbi:PepSY-associated TM helix domain-containing protein [Granulosicoccus antarcticus]|uniref:PepSY-associated TM helix domain-containing protein n=1 Tax=Granulosicoccus antarcticus TaxID=437505 RepID=UPI00197AA77A|nr:PepSY domain-containing protein [Granulosicoccus antarcticus]
MNTQTPTIDSSEKLVPAAAEVTPPPPVTPQVSTKTTTQTTSHSKLYLAAWRWHFYAGLYVIPFLLILAMTGMAMLWTSTLFGRDGERMTVVMQGEPMAVSQQAAAAQSAVPEGELVQYIAPLSPDLAAIFSMKTADETLSIAVNPYTAQVLDQTSRENSWYNLFDNIHGSLLLGTTGDRLIEIAASLSMVLIATGLYLWWPKKTGLLAALIPNVRARGRALWKSLHVSVGVWISLLLFVFLLTGLSWAGVWGEKLVQAWNTLPAEKYGAPQSEDIHASMNHDGTKQVPWALEQTPMPASGSDAGSVVMTAAMPVDIDSVATLARGLGFEQRFQLNLPQGETGVWTISRDSMSSDSTEATTDRTVHVDQFSGKVLADIGFQDYSIYGQAMAAGVGFHMGTLGLWNVALNTVFCLSVIFLCISGAIMWWKRRPVNAGRLVAPPMPANMPHWRGAALTGLAISLFFPMAGIALLVVMFVDFLIVSRVPMLKRALS